VDRIEKNPLKDSIGHQTAPPDTAALQTSHHGHSKYSTVHSFQDVMELILFMKIYFFLNKQQRLKAAYVQTEASHEHARHVLATLQSFNRPQKVRPLTVSC